MEIPVKRKFQLVFDAAHDSDGTVGQWHNPRVEIGRTIPHYTGLLVTSRLKRYIDSATWLGAERGLQLVTLSCLAFISSLPAQIAPSVATTVSAASYDPVVAPDSLASVFGVDFTDETVIAQLEEPGENLPTSLAGVSVWVNGSKAGLLFISPTQINVLIPPETAIGRALLSVVSDQGGVIASGLVVVASVAPSLFQFDDAPGGTGAIQNGVTFASGPFDVETPENPGADKRTRLVVYGTGLRDFPADEIQAQAEAGGQRLLLPIEYVGPSTFFGLDQVNVLLPEGLSLNGTVGLRIGSVATISNRVTFELKQPEAHAILSVLPNTASPGTEVAIHGSGFVTGDRVYSRSSVVFRTPDGRDFSAAPLASSPDILRVSVPALPTAAAGEWYSGALTVCVVIDGQNKCIEDALVVTARQQTTRLGDLLFDTRAQAWGQLVDDFRALGLANEAEELQQAATSDVASLRTQIDLALAGTPEVIEYVLPDGTVSSAQFDRDAIAKLELLIDGFGRPTPLRAQPAVAAESSARPDRHILENCMSEAERERADARKEIEKLESLATSAAQIGADAYTSAFIACLPAGAVPALPLVTLCGTQSSLANAINMVTKTVKYYAWVKLIPLKYFQANYFYELEVSPEELSVEVGQSGPFKLQGRFGPSSLVGSAAAAPIIDVVTSIIAKRIRFNLGGLDFGDLPTELVDRQKQEITDLPGL